MPDYDVAARLFAKQSLELERLREQLSRMHLVIFEAWDRCEWRLPEWFECRPGELPYEAVSRLCVELLERGYNERWRITSP